MNRTTSLLIAAAAALGLAGCASGDDETAASTTEVVVGAASDTPATTDAPVSSATAPVETTAPPETSEPEPPPTSAPEPPPTTAAPGGDFCDELRAFLTAWVDDEIGPADLTPLYASLAAIAPPELVEPLRILEEDNAILVDTLDSGEIDEAAYFAAGEQLAAYAEDECGIALEEL